MPPHLLIAELIQGVYVVVVRFKAVGNAPIMKQNFYKITASNRFQAVVQFLRKELAWKASDPLVRVMSTEWSQPDAHCECVASSHTLTSLSRHRWMILSPTCTRYLRLACHLLSRQLIHHPTVFCNRGTPNSKLQVHISLCFVLGFSSYMSYCSSTAAWG